MDATCKIQDNIHVFSLAHKYVSRILGTYQNRFTVFSLLKNKKRGKQKMKNIDEKF